VRIKALKCSATLPLGHPPLAGKSMVLQQPCPFRVMQSRNGMLSLKRLFYGSNFPNVCVRFLLGSIPLPTVPFLQSSDQLVFLAGDDIQVVIGELAPFGFDTAFELFPVAFYLIPIHNLDLLISVFISRKSPAKY
jgi:hypothetical protein